MALGEPASGVEGFRRTHQQALRAQSVALAAGPNHIPVTYFVDVAPVAMMCADIESAREWVSETLGPLAIDSERNTRLRETARVFLQTGSSYTSTAEQLFLHRNTAHSRRRISPAAQLDRAGLYCRPDGHRLPPASISSCTIIR